jgi:hypothetical protein
MKELTPDIALEKYYEMWIAMAKVEKENEINEKDFYRFEFRMDFKEDWCRKKGENPVNNCYLCEYAVQSYLSHKTPEESKRLFSLIGLDEPNPTIFMTDSICKHCPILWSKDRDNNNCEKDVVCWSLSPIKDILMLPLNKEELDEYSKNHT